MAKEIVGRRTGRGVTTKLSEGREDDWEEVDRRGRVWSRNAKTMGAKEKRNVESRKLPKKGEREEKKKRNRRGHRKEAATKAVPL